MIGTRFINSFLEKKFFGGEWGPILGPKILKILDLLLEILKILHNEIGQELDENNINDPPPPPPPKKYLFRANGPFWTQKWPILITLYWP